jgi:hypothetical protein
MPSLLFDGQRVLDDQTAADLEMEDGDSLEVLLERESPASFTGIGPASLHAARGEVKGTAYGSCFRGRLYTPDVVPGVNKMSG